MAGDDSADASEDGSAVGSEDSSKADDGDFAGHGNWASAMIVILLVVVILLLVVILLKIGVNPSISFKIMAQNVILSGWPIWNGNKLFW